MRHQGQVSTKVSARRKSNVILRKRLQGSRMRYTRYTESGRTPTQGRYTLMSIVR
jgi:hypothetical protein